MQESSLNTADIIVFISYAIALLSIALWVSRKSKREGDQLNKSEEYFLAGKSLPWWAIGASLIASNISAEQIIGMSGSGYAMGLAIASYEWMAALTLIIVGKFMLPIFIKNNINTMPGYLEQRFDVRVKTVMACFWLGVYIFVNLTAVLWLGGLAIATITGLDWTLSAILLCAFSIAYSLYGGLKAVAYTDIFQVVLLVIGGLIVTYLGLQAIDENNNSLSGFNTLTTSLPTHFDMILDKSNEFYSNLPGISVLIGGLWVANFSYWGFNQYIIQRALAAKNLREAQKGIAFAAYLKLLMPLIVVFPGIIAVILYPNLDSPDKAYPTMMMLMPAGVKGLVFAALVASIVSSMASMTNSISTIFTMDLYRTIRPERSQQHYVNTGRLVTLLSLLISLVVAKPLLGEFDQAFQFIQEFTGFFTPGIVVIFVTGMFWSKANSNGALAAGLGSVVFSLGFKLFLPELPFLDRIGLVFIVALLLCVFVSQVTPSSHANACVKLEKGTFETSSGYKFATAGVLLILTAFYATWW